MTGRGESYLRDCRSSAIAWILFGAVFKLREGHTFNIFSIQKKYHNPNASWKWRPQENTKSLTMSFSSHLENMYLKKITQEYYTTKWYNEERWNVSYSHSNRTRTSIPNLQQPFNPHQKKWGNDICCCHLHLFQYKQYPSHFILQSSHRWIAQIRWLLRSCLNQAE